MQDQILETARETKGFRAGKTFSEIDGIYRASAGECAICGAKKGKRNHSLDHDHSTGKLRGVLRHKCNVGLGHFNDDPALLRQAADYIEKHSGS